MPSPTITSNFNKIIAAFIIFAVITAGVEWYTYANRAEIIDDYWNKFIINEHFLLDRPKDFDYLIIGDSIQKTGIDPTKVDDRLLNLGLPGGKPLGLYLLFKRYLERHKSPKAVFLYVDPEDAHDSLFVILRYFVSVGEALSVWRDLTPAERQVFIMRYWATLDLRKVGLKVRDLYPYPNSVFVKSMLEHNGYMKAPRALRALPGDYFVTNRGRIQREVSFNGTDMKYLDKFMRLAGSKGVRVVFLGFPVPRELYYIFEDTGFNKSYRSFYSGLKTRYPNAVFTDEPVIYFDNRYFGDSSHVNDEGSAVYTDQFKDRVFAPFLASAGTEK